MHGDIGYKFCWLLPFEDHNQGTPAGHESAETSIGKHESEHQYSFMDQIFSIIITNRKYNIYSFS